jgi:two-component system nitrogen regulation response regulator GlnG
MNQHVWVIDDDSAIRWVLDRALSQAGIPITAFNTADQALHHLGDDSPLAIITDIRMPGTSGLEFLRQVKEVHHQVPIIVMTAHSDLQSAVTSFERGAFEYLPKPFDVDEAVAVVRRAIAQTEDVKSVSLPEPTGSTEIIGQAPAMQEVFRAIGRLSSSNVSVLINGPSGSGKELVARALHRHSPRQSEPFVALNVAAIPSDLIESELFGHEKGAFTGAAQRRVGRFEQADGGTLFLDEIGDMPASAQTRLLRVLGRE